MNIKEQIQKENRRGPSTELCGTPVESLYRQVKIFSMSCEMSVNSGKKVTVMLCHEFLVLMRKDRIVLMMLGQDSLDDVLKLLIHQ